MAKSFHTSRMIGKGSSEILKKKRKSSWEIEASGCEPKKQEPAIITTTTMEFRKNDYPISRLLQNSDKKQGLGDLLTDCTQQ